MNFNFVEREKYQDLSDSEKKEVFDRAVQERSEDVFQRYCTMVDQTGGKGVHREKLESFLKNLGGYPELETLVAESFRKGEVYEAENLFVEEVTTLVSRKIRDLFLS